MEAEPPFDVRKIGFVSLIQELDRQSRSGENVTLGDAFEHAGVRVHGAAILLMALPECIPLPIPSIGAVLGVPLITVSVHMALYAERGNLPANARSIALPQQMIEMMSRYMIGPLRYVERISRPRLSRLASHERLIGIVCVLMSLLLLLQQVMLQ